MRTIRRKQALAIKDIAADAIKDALAGEGLEVWARGMNWNGGKVTLTIDVTLPGVSQQEARAKEAEVQELCARFALPDDVLTKEFYLKVKKETLRVKVVDIKPRNHKYPIIVEVIDHRSRLYGKRFKSSTRHVLDGLESAA